MLSLWVDIEDWREKEYETERQDLFRGHMTITSIIAEIEHV